MIMIVKTCDDCPFCHRNAPGEAPKACVVSTPRFRPILDDDGDRPQWCKLRKEQFIVREF